MNKKLYRRPAVISNSESLGFIPAALAALGAAASTSATAASIGAALAGGYVAGRVVKSMEARPTEPQLRALRKVCY